MSGVRVEGKCDGSGNCVPNDPCASVSYNSLDPCKVVTCDGSSGTAALKITNADAGARCQLVANGTFGTCDGAGKCNLPS